MKPAAVAREPPQALVRERVAERRTEGFCLSLVPLLLVRLWARERLVRAASRCRGRWLPHDPDARLALR